MSIYGPCDNESCKKLLTYLVILQKTYTATQTNLKVNKAGDSLSGDLNLSGNSIFSLDTPASYNDDAKENISRQNRST